MKQQNQDFYLWSEDVAEFWSDVVVRSEVVKGKLGIMRYNLLLNSHVLFYQTDKPDRGFVVVGSDTERQEFRSELFEFITEELAQ